MKIFIDYPKRSCVTGKALRLALKAKRKLTTKRAKADLLVRYGSSKDFPTLTVKKEINSKESVALATDKLEALKRLKEQNINTINFSNQIDELPSFLNKEGNVYIRSKSGVVRYGNDFNESSDSYFSQPVKFKRREYRVHVFGDEVIGIYEKVPMVEGAENRPKLFKSDTCHFRRCDPANCRINLDQQQMCIDSVKALGLKFGGVDLIRDKNGEVFICEVNSAPGLNSNMIQKYVELILKELE